MGFKTSFVLICNWKSYCLYRIQDRTTHLLIEDPHPEVVLNLLEKEKITHLNVYDHTYSQVSRIETVVQRLSFYDYMRWFHQKKKFAAQQGKWYLVKSLWQSQSILISTIGETPSLITLTEKLKQAPFTFSVLSYPLSLAYFFRQRLKVLHPEIISPVLVLVDRFARIGIFFYRKNNLSFVRECFPTAQYSTNEYIKSSVYETMRHLEKMVPINQTQLIFFIESHDMGSDLRDAFPQSLFFFNQQLIHFITGAHTDVSDKIFDRILLSFKLPRYRFMLNPKCAQRFQTVLPYVLPGAKVGTALSLVWAFYFVYITLLTIEQNRQLSKTAYDLTVKIERVDHRIRQLPLNEKQVSYVQKILEKSQEQAKDLWRLLDLVAHILDDKYTLHSLSVTPQKSRLLVEGMGHSGDVDALLDLWQQTLPDIRFISPPDQASPFLTLDTASPFQGTQ
jgi:hypothetical protein